MGVNYFSAVVTRSLSLTLSLPNLYVFLQSPSPFERSCHKVLNERPSRGRQRRIPWIEQARLEGVGYYSRVIVERERAQLIFDQRMRLPHRLPL